MTQSDVMKLASGLAALESTVKIECEHINKRLDSHSLNIRDLTRQVERINLASAKKEAANGVKEAMAGQVCLDQRETKRFWRQAWFQVSTSLLIFMLGSEFGHSFIKLIKGFVGK